MEVEAELSAVEVEVAWLEVVPVAMQEQADEIREGSAWHLGVVRSCNGVLIKWDKERSSLLGNVVWQVSGRGVDCSCVCCTEVGHLWVPNELSEAVVAMAAVWLRCRISRFHRAGGAPRLCCC